MALPSDIKFYYSGGIANTSQDDSLGGSISQTEVVPYSENIFSLADGQQCKTGLTDYRCIYLKNTSGITSFYESKLLLDIPQNNTPPMLSLGFNKVNDVQRLSLSGTITGGGIFVMYQAVDGSVYDTGYVIYDNITNFASNLQRELNSLLKVGGGVVCEANTEAGFSYITVTFTGISGYKFHNLLQVVENDLTGVGASATFTKIIDGGPINSTASPIGVSTATPANVTFATTGATVSLGTLLPEDYIPIWIKRVVPPGTKIQDESGGTLKFTCYAFPFIVVPAATPTPCIPKSIATYKFNQNLKAEERNKPDLQPIDGSGLNKFELSTAMSGQQYVYIFDGKTPTLLQGGFNLNASNLVDYDNYSVELILKFSKQTPPPDIYGLYGQGGSTSGEAVGYAVSSPTQVGTNTSWYKLSSNFGFHSTAIKNDGTLWNWGNNSYGQLGDNTITHKSSPIQTIAGGQDWTLTEASSQYSLGLKSDGTLWGWGRGQLGTLGNNDDIDVSSPVQVIGSNYTTMSAGTNHAAAVKSDGTLWLWGVGDFGCLGNNTGSGGCSSPIQTIAGGTNWLDVKCGLFFTVGLKQDGTLWTWGLNSYGQLGDGTTTSKSSPVQTSIGGSNWSKIAASEYNIAAIKTDGSMWLCGKNNIGQLGDGTTTNRSVPQQTIATGNDWDSVSVKLETTVGIKKNGTLWGMGNGSLYSLKDQSNTNYSSPVQLSTYSNYKQICMGTLARLTLQSALGKRKIVDSNYRNSDKGLYVNQLGYLQMESGNTGVISLQEDQYYNLFVSNHSSISEVSVKVDGSYDLVASSDSLSLNNMYNPGHILNFFLDDVQVPKEYGNGKIAYLRLYNGSLCSPTGTPLPTSMPTPLPTPSPTATPNPTISPTSTPAPTKTPGPTSTPAPTNAVGGLYMVGENSSSQLGDGTIVSKSSPIQITNAYDWATISCGVGFTGAIKTDANLYMWGANLVGQIGNNTILDISMPTQVMTDKKFKHLYCGNINSVAIDTDGKLWAWGANFNGHLGDNTTKSRSSPVQTVTGGNTWIYASCSLTNSAGVKRDGTLWTWGENSSGNLGINKGLSYTGPAVISVSSPIQTIAGGNNWSTVHCGGGFMVGLKKDGTLWTWGRNTFGQLGDNNYTHKSSPVQTYYSTNTWSAASAGQNHAAGIKADGTLWLWGSNAYGQLGTGNINPTSIPVQTIGGGTNWSKVSCGTYTTAAVKYDGTLWVWGKNTSGQLGRSDKTHRSSPIQMICFGTNWSTVSASFDTIGAI